MHEIKARIAPEDREALEFALFETEAEHNWILLDDVIANVADVQGVFESEAEARAAWAELAAQLADPGEPAYREVRDEDWKNAYKAHFKPWSYGSIHWVPVWLKDKYEVPDGHGVVFLDPGMAFGTGNHATTRLCVEQLVAFKGTGASKEGLVVDAGCGSGILAISAVQLGFSKVRAFDNDEDAVAIARENATENGVDASIFDTGDLVTGFSGQPAQCVMANILANVLMQFSRELVDAVAPGGWLILSGILREEAEQVRSHFRGHGCFDDGRIDYLDEWSSVRLIRR